MLACAFVLVAALSWLTPLEWGLVARFCAHVVLVFAFVAGTVLLHLFGPPARAYRGGDWDDRSKWIRPPVNRDRFYVVLDVHAHTTHSDGKLGVEELVRYHRAVGFNACAVTDHNTLAGLAEAREAAERWAGRFVLLPGVEWTTSRVHLCLLGVTDEELCRDVPQRPTDGEIEAIVRATHERGGVVVACHFPWSTGGPKPRMPDHPTLRQLHEWGVDLVEVANWDDDVALVDRDALTYLEGLDEGELGPCVGTDVHRPEEAVPCGWTLVSVREFTAEGVLEALRARKTSVHLVPVPLAYPFVHRPPLAYRLVQPLAMVGATFASLHQGGSASNLDWGGVTSWLAYFLGAFVLLEWLGRLFGAW
ncbi:MAG: hypothetical protein Kow0069_29430 [Promethearchaeota archaeon]